MGTILYFFWFSGSPVFFDVKMIAAVTPDSIKGITDLDLHETSDEHVQDAR